MGDTLCIVTWLQGQSWRLGLKTILGPIYRIFDQNKVVRGFAKDYVYSKEVNTNV
jgi:hypothetical protein